MKKKNKIDYSSLSLLSHIGYSVIIPILLCLYIGGLIDEKAGTGGIFTIIFIILGAAAGILNIFKITDKYTKRK
jgi:F0F1-type ATP synthase assembly protein I